MGCAQWFESGRNEFGLLRPGKSLEDGRRGLGETVFALDNDEHGRARAAKCRAKNAVLADHGQENRQERADGRAIRLMDAVGHGDAEQVGAGLGEGEAEHGNGLNVGDDVAQWIAGGEHGAGFAGGQLVRG